MKSKRVAILQSNYIPWRGYFDIINSVDEFIVFDEMQYTRRDWRNRNKIKTPQGAQWLTIPVLVKNKYFQTIRETKIDGGAWAQAHWKSIQQNYSKAPYFGEYKKYFEEIYLNLNSEKLSDVNMKFLAAICQILEIKTTIKQDVDYGVIEGKSERLLDLCQKSGATVYLSGPSAKDYLDTELFNNAGIGVEWFSYESYGSYAQLYPPFDPFVSAIDMIFNLGPDAKVVLRDKKALIDAAIQG